MPSAKKDSATQHKKLCVINKDLIFIDTCACIELATMNHNILK